MPTKPSARTLLDDVLAIAKASRNGPVPWVEKLPPDLRGELEHVKAAFRSGTIDIRKNALAKAIKDNVEARGHSCVNQAGVVRWLDQS